MMDKEHPDYDYERLTGYPRGVDPPFAPVPRGLVEDLHAFPFEEGDEEDEH